MPRTLGIQSANHLVLNLQDLFGDDTPILEKTCEKIFQNWLHPDANYYVPASKPKFRDAFCSKKCSGSSLSVREIYDEMVSKWTKQYPDEAQKEAESIRKSKAEMKNNFSIIYGIAKSHGVQLKWCGGSEGDRWIVRKNDTYIGFLAF